jgi:hypothetical protein
VTDGREGVFLEKLLQHFLHAIVPRIAGEVMHLSRIRALIVELDALSASIPFGITPALCAHGMAEIRKIAGQAEAMAPI